MSVMTKPEQSPKSVELDSHSSGATDARLVEDVRRGDHESFRELVQRYERRVLRVIMRFVTDQDQARDLAQETFLRTYEKLDQFDPSRRFGPWLFRIAVNLTLDFLRKRKRTGRTSVFSDAGEDYQHDPAVEDPRQGIDLRQEIDAVLEQIPEKYRMVLVMRDLENFSSSEIAAITERKEATIRWRLAEARNRFKELWERRTGLQVPENDKVEDDEDSER